jgi:DNA invertase Pin-like site-specific DNA recombinase
MRAAIYTRVSDPKKQDAGRQTDESRQFCAARKWTVVVEESDGMSGAKDKRPGLERVMKLARGRKIDVVVVQAVDRFGRSMRHFVNTIAELDALGVAFVSTSQGFDMTTPMGKYIVSSLALVAELERSFLVERIRSGLARARREGKQIGRQPRVPVDVAKLRRLTKAGASLWERSRQLGVSRNAVRTALKSL